MYIIISLSINQIRVITKLSNSEQSYKGKVKTHNYINRQNQLTTENCENRNDPDLVQAFIKKWWVESDFKAPNLPLSLRFKGPAVTVTVFKYRNKIGKIDVKAVPVRYIVIYYYIKVRENRRRNNEFTIQRHQRHRQQ